MFLAMMKQPYEEHTKTKKSVCAVSFHYNFLFLLLGAKIKQEFGCSKSNLQKCRVMAISKMHSITHQI